MPEQENTFSLFGGLKDDTDPKKTPPEYFTEVTNFNFPDTGLPGMDKILMPTQIAQQGTSQIDGMHEYRYLDGTNVLQTEQICVTQGCVIKNALLPHTAHAVTFTATPTNTVNYSSHPFNNGDGISFSVTGSGALPAAITAGTIYFVVGSATNTFQISATSGGSAIAFATVGTTPTQSVVGVSTVLKKGLSSGRVSFATYNDKLFIANGLNYVNIYYGSLGLVAEMGAPVAVLTVTAGSVEVGAHYYAMTYTTAGGEEVIGSVSNTVIVTSSGKQITLYLPIGYAGTTSRKLYRTEAGGTALKLLATVANNTTLTYTDNIADASLTTAIPAVNNELPKPYFMTVAAQSLYGSKVSKFPTQVFKTDPNIEVIDAANYIDVANYGNDNTPIEGIGVDFNQVIVGTAKQIYFVDPTATSIGVSTVQPTRANVGVKSGYSMVSVPAFGDFPGGLMFLSTLNDVRIVSGQQKLPVTTTFGNISTENWAQNIRQSLNTDLGSYTNIAAEFFNYRYHLAIDSVKYVFDIRAKGWTTHDIQSTSYQSKPRCFAVMNSPQRLYNGQSDGWIESEYYGIQYRGQEVTAVIISAYLDATRLFKWFKKLVFWFKTSLTSSTTITAVLDSNENYPITATIPLYGGVFNPTYFNSTYFLTSGRGDSDYRVVNINNPCRWVRFELSCTSGNITFLEWSAVGHGLKNEESV